MPALSLEQIAAVFDSFGDEAKANGVGKQLDLTPLELQPLNLAQYDTEPIPHREWGVRDRFPKRNVALLSGHGGVGKSIVLLQLAGRTCSARTGCAHCPNKARCWW